MLKKMILFQKATNFIRLQYPYISNNSITHCIEYKRKLGFIKDVVGYYYFCAYHQNAL